jgi:hypothetical protein
MPIAILVILVLAATVLVGLAGLVLLVVGIIRRSAPMWVCGIIGIGLAGLALLAGVGVGLCFRLAKPVTVVRASPRESGDYVRFADGQATARVEGVEFTVLGPGSGGASSSVRTKSGLLPNTSETRHEVRLGEVTIVVEKRDSRLTLSVNATDYGPVSRGDSVLINEAREVLINGQRRLP